MKLSVLFESTAAESLETYVSQIRATLLDLGVDPHDADQLIAGSMEAIREDFKIRASIKWPIQALLKKHERQQDQQRTRDTQRDIEQNRQLAQDIRTGKRPGPRRPPLDPQVQKELDDLLDDFDIQNG